MAEDRSLSSGRPIRQPVATPKHRNPRRRKYRPIAEDLQEKQIDWKKVLTENSNLIVEEVTWSDELVDYVGLESPGQIFNKEEIRNVKVRRGHHRGRKIINYLQEKSYDNFIEFLCLLSEKGYTEIKLEILRELEPNVTKEDEFELDEGEYIGRKQDQLKMINMERKNEELKKELERKDREMQQFLAGIIDTVKNNSDCKVDVGPTVKLEMKTCSNVIKSTFSQLTKKLHGAESSTSNETVQRLESVIQNLREMNSTQEKRLLKYEKDLTQARKEVEIIKRQAERKDNERAHAIENLQEVLREKEEEIAQIKQSHREDMMRINAKFEDMKQKHLKAVVDNERKLSETRDEYNWKMESLQRDYERSLSEMKESVARAESRVGVTEARLQKLETKVHRDNAVTTETSLENLKRKSPRENGVSSENGGTLPPLNINRKSQSTLIDYTTPRFYVRNSRPRSSRQTDT